MEHDLIKSGGRVVILSSVWELLTRQDKFAYTVTKAAVGGLVRSMAVDLGAAKGILVNGILPGIVDTPMARGLLKPEQMDAVQQRNDLICGPCKPRYSRFASWDDPRIAVSGHRDRSPHRLQYPDPISA